MVSVSAEVSSLRKLETESKRLYDLLQSSVDEQIKGSGFLPDAISRGIVAGNGKSSNGSGPRPAPSAQADGWGCSEKQRNFILKLAKESEITERELDATAERLFAAPACALDRKQASRFINELLVITGRETGNGSPTRRSAKSPATA
jgi:hypothetical protein